MNRFVERFTSSIVSVLGCHDRVIFRGHLPFGGDEHLNRFVDYALKIKRKDFLPFVEPLSESLVDHAKHLAQQANAPYHHFEAKPDKEKLIHKLLREEAPMTTAWSPYCAARSIAAPSNFCMANSGRGWRFDPGLSASSTSISSMPTSASCTSACKPCFLSPVRSMSTATNGSPANSTRASVGFVQADNAFVDIDDFDKAQELADQFSKLNWVKILDRFVQQASTRYSSNPGSVNAPIVG